MRKNTIQTAEALRARRQIQVGFGYTREALRHTRSPRQALQVIGLFGLLLLGACGQVQPAQPPVATTSIGDGPMCHPDPTCRN